VPTESHTQQSQPHCVMCGYANSVEILEENNQKTAIIYIILYLYEWQLIYTMVVN
jgi:hypothetical protein